jgi:parallel beta-helix repeat protein
MKHILSALLLVVTSTLPIRAQVVEKVRYDQRTDGSLLVDIYYDVTHAGGLPLTIAVEASDDHGATWNLPCNSLTGDVGAGIPEGTGKHVVWDFYADNPDTSGYGYRVRVWAEIDICGQTITKDLTLTRDVNCAADPAPVINIGASDITIDLGGHTIMGGLQNGFREYIICEDFDRITVRNGTMTGFINGIILGRSDNSIVENMIMKNLEIEDPDIPVSGIIVGSSGNVLIHDCQFEFLFAAHKEAVILGNSKATIDNITTLNGSVGVNFGGDGLIQRTTGIVKNCKFINNSISSVLLQQTNNARIINNEFINSSISLDPFLEGTVTGVTIDNNFLHDSHLEAIFFRGGKESVISNNIITNNLIGISLTESRGCGPDSVTGAECSYSTGNLIVNNTVLGNWIDLSHCEKCVGNTWQGNVFETALGAEIYTAEPVTANAFLSDVDSVAATLAADARLIFVFSGHRDSTGRSIKWIYIYRSASEQKDYELWYHDGKVIKRNAISIPYMFGEGHMPITDPWIDSDEAMAIADGMGGKEFRDTHEILAIEMSLSNTNWFFWQINIHAQDDVFRASFDATRK